MKYADILGVHDHIQMISENPKESVTIYHRLATALQKKDAVRWERLRKHHLEGNLKFDLLVHRLTGKGESHSIVKAIKSLFPIHPYTAYLLRFITQRCGSTERILRLMLYQ